MTHVTAGVDGMMCSMCEAHISDAIRKKFPDAKHVKASAKKGEADFDIEENIPKTIIQHELKQEFDSIGYGLLSVDTQDVKEEKKKGLFHLFK